jgi:hypothetical protein
MMKTYVVEWSMEFEAETSEDAARQALAVHRNPESIATVFDVLEADGSGEAIRVDVTELDNEAQHGTYNNQLYAASQ